MDGARFSEMFVLICQAARGVSQNKALFIIFFITFLEHKSLYILLDLNVFKSKCR